MKVVCPYCKKDLTKAIKLFGDDAMNFHIALHEKTKCIDFLLELRNENKQIKNKIDNFLNERR